MVQVPSCFMGTGSDRVNASDNFPSATGSPYYHIHRQALTRAAAAHIK